MNISDKSKQIIDSCRFCFMCRHVCPIGNATGHERNTARGRSMGAALVTRGVIDCKDIADNLYECMLCGACTNNCVTGWDPKVFIREMRRELVLEGKTPEYINKLIENYVNCGNIYGREVDAEIKSYLTDKDCDTLVFLGEDAIINSKDSVKGAKAILDKAGVDYTFGNVISSGNSLYFLTGNTQETIEQAKVLASYINKFNTVVVYDPVDLSLIMHEYKEWGIEVTAKVISFNEYLLNLIESGKIAVKKSSTEYTLQDNCAYARDLDNLGFGRKIIEKVGVVKDVLLIEKEANLAGSLIMNEYMPETIKAVAKTRWEEAERMNCTTFVTENPAEYEMLKATTPKGKRVITIENMIMENM